MVEVSRNCIYVEPVVAPDNFAIQKITLLHFIRYFALTQGRGIHVWHAPAREKEFRSFNLAKKVMGNYADTTSLDWSNDSRSVFVI